MRNRTPLATVTLLMFLPAAAIAQTAIDTSPGAQTGQQVYGSYFSSDIDTVSLFNGNLNLNIGLFSLPGREVPMGLNLSYNSQKYEALSWDDGSGSGDIFDSSGLGYTMYTGGWRIANPFGDNLQLSFDTSDWGEESGICWWYGSYVGVWIDGIGTKHTYTQPADGGYWECPDGWDWTIDITTLGTMHVDSVDGDRSQLTLDYPNGQIAFADGSFLNFSFSSGFYRPVKWISRNGNYLEKATNGSQLPAQDTLGRTVSYTAGSWSGGYLSDVYTIVDSNGTNRNYTITYKTMTVFSNIGGTTYGATMGSNKNLISSITLPNGKQWLFEYFHNQGFLTKVTFPSGGYIKYSYVNQGTYGMGLPSGYSPNYYALRADDAVVERRVSADGTTGGEKVWTYTRSGTSTITMMVASPDGTAVEHIFNSQGEEGTTKWRVSTTGSILKTVTNNWVNTSVASNNQPIDPHVTSVTTTLDSGLASTKTIARDSNKNLDYEQTTAYGISTVVAKKSYTYTSLSLGGSSPYYTRYLPASEALYGLDPSSSSTTLVQYGYRTYSYDGYSVTDRGTSVPNSTHSTTATGRGNLTKTRTYKDASSYLETQMKYDNLGNLIETIDPLSHSTTVDFTDNFTDSTNRNAFAYPKKVTNPLSQYATSKYDFNTGLVKEVTNLRGNTTTTAYDLLNRITTITEPAVSSVSKVTTYAYDDDNRKTTKEVTVDTSSNKGHVETFFDKLYRTVKTVTNDPEGAITAETEYDGNGRVKQASNPYRSGDTVVWTQTAYDALGRPTTVTAPDSSTVSYTYANNVTTTTDQAGNQRRYTYNILGQLTQVEEPNPTLATAAVTTYKYYVFGPLYQSDQASQARTWVYNWLGQMTSQTLPESGATSFTYDGGGRLSTKTDARSIVTTMAYDNANRVTGRSYSDSTPSVSFTYDGSSQTGLRTAMSDGLGSVAYTYDTRDRLTSEARTLTGISGTFTTSYVYNVKGDVTQMTYPSGRVVNFGYATSGGCCNSRLSSVADGTTSTTLLNTIAFNAAGGVTSQTLNPGANAISESFTYNNRMQLTQIQATKSSTTLMDFSYDYGTSSTNTGRVLSRTDAVQPEHSAGYVYDPLYRLQQAYATGVGSAWSVAWTFDTWGNRLTQTPVGLATSKVGSPSNSYSNNRLTNITNLSYDNAGNLTNEGTGGHAYTYNAENQQISMDSTAATYTYDGEGRRMKKTVSGVSTYFFYGPGGLLCEFSTSTSDSSATAASSTDKTIYRTSEKTGSAVLLFNTSGTVIENNRTLPYGEAWLADVAAANNKKFTTYDRDKESGLDYAMARMYVNTGGRFSSPDQGRIVLAIPTSLNRYTYGNLDPINNIDPSGNEIPNYSVNVVGSALFNAWDFEFFFPRAINPAWILSWLPWITPTLPSIPGGGGPSPTQANCQSGLQTAQKTSDAVVRAKNAQNVLIDAVKGTDIPWGMLAAIGIRETGFLNVAEVDGAGVGVGIFQITVGRATEVSAEQAGDLKWAANYAAHLLQENYGVLKSYGYTGSALMQATAASFNMAPTKINFTGNPNTIDDGTTHNNYGSNVTNLMDCFK